MGLSLHRYFAVASPDVSSLLQRPTLRGLTHSSISRDEQDYCELVLDDVAVNGYVGENEYLRFVERFDEKTLVFDRFDELPSELVLLFYTAACTGGRDCTTTKPQIYVSHVKASEAFLQVLCASVKRIVVEQVSLNLQYQVKVSGQRNFPDNEIVENLSQTLEQAISRIVLQGLGCKFDVDQGPEVKTSSNAKSSNAQHCDYNVMVHVSGARQMPCLEMVDHSSSSMMDDLDAICLFLSSKIRITEAALILPLTPVELRRTILAILNGAIEARQFDNYLKQ